MLKVKNRLILSKDFDSVHKLGRFFSFGQVFLKISKNDFLETRIGISIGIKFSKKAVDRNKAKRQLREIIKKQLDNLKPGFDVVIMLKKEKNPPIYSKLEQEIGEIFLKSGLIVKK